MPFRHFIIACWFASLAHADLVPARPFADHMVLPMERKVPVWGTATPGATVEIRFGGNSSRGKADAQGHWKIELPPQKPSAEGRELGIRSDGEELVLRDVLVGEVWLCSGQSNMDFPLAKAVGGKQEAAGAGNHPFRPGFLFDSGVRWWADFPLTGVLWYQGETNAEILDDNWNERLITDLVHGWRKVLAQPDLPFFMVQLPRIGGNDPLRRGWPQFRAVQARAAAKLDHVSLIETVDLGWDSPDVHPPDKRPVGERLGKAAAR